MDDEQESVRERERERERESRQLESVDHHQENGKKRNCFPPSRRCLRRSRDAESVECHKGRVRHRLHQLVAKLAGDSACEKATVGGGRASGVLLQSIRNHPCIREACVELQVSTMVCRELVPRGGITHFGSCQRKAGERRICKDGRRDTRGIRVWIRSGREEGREGDREGGRERERKGGREGGKDAQEAMNKVREKGRMERGKWTVVVDENPLAGREAFAVVLDPSQELLPDHQNFQLAVAIAACRSHCRRRC